MAERSTALVTGANKGIGLEIARGLARQGHQVWLGCRDPHRGEAAVADLKRDGLDAHPLRIDVADDASVAAAAERLAGDIGHLDALVNNAGVSTGWKGPIEETMDEVRAVYEVNVFGPIRTTKAFLPLLKASKAPRVVMMSSTLGSLAWTSDFEAPNADINLLGYGSSKTALNAIMVSFAKALGPQGFKVNAGCPGYVATDLNQHQGHRTPEQGAAIAIRLATLAEDGPNGGYFNEDGPIAW